MNRMSTWIFCPLASRSRMICSGIATISRFVCSFSGEAGLQSFDLQAGESLLIGSIDRIGGLFVDKESHGCRCVRVDEAGGVSEVVTFRTTLGDCDAMDGTLRFANQGNEVGTVERCEAAIFPWICIVL